jgi:hypothetical protein
MNSRAAACAGVVAALVLAPLLGGCASGGRSGSSGQTVAEACTQATEELADLSSAATTALVTVQTDAGVAKTSLDSLAAGLAKAGKKVGNAEVKHAIAEWAAAARVFAKDLGTFSDDTSDSAAVRALSTDTQDYADAAAAYVRVCGS